MGIILEINSRTVPIKVKYQNHIYDRDLKILLYFMDVYDLVFGVVITKNLFEQRGIFYAFRHDVSVVF